MGEFQKVSIRFKGRSRDFRGISSGMFQGILVVFYELQGFSWGEGFRTFQKRFSDFQCVSGVFQRRYSGFQRHSRGFQGTSAVFQKISAAFKSISAVSQGFQMGFKDLPGNFCGILGASGMIQEAPRSCFGFSMGFNGLPGCFQGRFGEFNAFQRRSRVFFKRFKRLKVLTI